MNNWYNSNLCLDTFRGKGILITGGAGYLATALISLLQEIDCRIIRLDRQDACWEQVRGSGEIADRRGDVRDPATWQRHLDGIDFVFHFSFLVQCFYFLFHSIVIEQCVDSCNNPVDCLQGGLLHASLHRRQAQAKA